MKKVVNRVARGKGGVDDDQGDDSGEDDGKPLNGDDGEGEAGELAQDETHPKLKDHLIGKHRTRHNEPRHRVLKLDCQLMYIKRKLQLLALKAKLVKQLMLTQKSIST